MRRLPSLLFLLFLWMAFPAAVSGQQTEATPTPNATNQEESPPPQPGQETVRIRYPLENETLTGSIPIEVEISLPGVNSWELAFSFSENPTETWFLLAQGSQPFSGQLLLWDTSALSDGDYSLRLRAYFSDAARDVRVEPLKIRNYSIDPPSPTASQTPSPTQNLSRTPAASSTATKTEIARLTPSPLPPNPAILEKREISRSALRGAGYSLLAFGVIGLLAWLKNRFTGKR